MNILYRDGVEFFKNELLKETHKQLEMFEEHPPEEVMLREVGRIRLYDERAKIQRHFLICEDDRGGFESKHPQHGILGKLLASESSAGLTWLEFEGIRHSIQSFLSPELLWEGGKLPKAHLTESGKFKKTKTHEELALN